MSLSFSKLEHRPKQESLPRESIDRLATINRCLLELENLSDYRLETRNGRAALNTALDLIFSDIDSIEGSGEEVEYEVVGFIKERIRDTYAQLYGISFDGVPGSVEAIEFYSDIFQIMELIEERGMRFIEDMDIRPGEVEEQQAA